MWIEWTFLNATHPCKATIIKCILFAQTLKTSQQKRPVSWCCCHGYGPCSWQREGRVFFSQKLTLRVVFQKHMSLFLSLIITIAICWGASLKRSTLSHWGLLSVFDGLSGWMLGAMPVKHVWPLSLSRLGLFSLSSNNAFHFFFSSSSCCFYFSCAVLLSDTVTVCGAEWTFALNHKKCAHLWCCSVWSTTTLAPVTLWQETCDWSSPLLDLFAPLFTFFWHCFISVSYLSYLFTLWEILKEKHLVGFTRTWQFYIFGSIKHELRQIICLSHCVNLFFFLCLSFLLCQFDVGDILPCKAMCVPAASVHSYQANGCFDYIVIFMHFI